MSLIFVVSPKLLSTYVVVWPCVCHVWCHLFDLDYKLEKKFKNKNKNYVILSLFSFSFLSLSPFIFLISHHCATDGVSFSPPVDGLKENKLDERIDINQQNLNNKTSNHKMRKEKLFGGLH